MKMGITDKIQSALSSRKPSVIDNRSGEFVHSSVLIPLFKSNEGYEVLFTERTHKVEHHKGQISFPGGAFEPGDKNFEDTALRESFEEVGLLQRDVKILGRLDDQVTVASNFVIHPFVGTIPYPYDFQINPDEVERIITVPFDLFFEENSEKHLNCIQFDTFTYRGPAYICGDVTVWGATAIIINKLVSILKGN